MSIDWFSSLAGRDRYRIGALIGLIGMMLSFLVNFQSNHLLDPVQLSRAFISLLLVGYLVLMRPGAVFDRHLLTGFLLINLVLIFHAMNVIWWTRLGLDVVASVFVIITIFCAIAINKQHLQMVLLCWLLLITVFVPFVPDPQVSKAHLIALLVPFSAVLYFFMGSLLALREELTKQQKWLDRSQAVAGIGGWEIDIASGHISYSSAARAILGWDELPSDIEGIARFFVMEEDFTVFHRALMACASGGADIDQMCLTQAPGTEKMWVHVRGERIQYGDAAPKLQGVFRDVTQTRQHEEELIAAKDEALLAVRSRARFLANMSHEIRTPMNGVLGMASLLDECELGARERSYVDIIRSSGDSLLTIINSILDFSKIESGSIELEQTHFNLEQVISESLDVVTPQAEAKGIKLYLDILALPGQDYIGDTGRLRQVLVNLLSNAVKFTETGSVTMTVAGERLATITAESVSPENADAPALPCVVLTIKVKDTGVGIADDAIAGLFDPFSQADASTTRRFGGTGLGLSISQEIANAMGGGITVESEPGAGSVFTLSLSLQSGGERQLPQLPADVSDLVLVTRNPTRANLASSRVALLGGKVTVLTDLTDMPPFDGGSVFVLDAESFTLGAIQAMCDRINATTSTVNGRQAQVVLMGGLSRRAQLSLPYPWLRAPVRPSELHALLTKPAAASHVEAPAIVSNEKFVGLRVLLAEDNIINQKVALQILRNLGIKADVANNGLEALQMVCQQTYDIVIMDIQMPEMDGLEATALIRANTDITQPRIIAMTANAMSEDKQACLAAGMNDFVAKPVRPMDLRQAILRSIEDPFADGFSDELPDELPNRF